MWASDFPWICVEPGYDKMVRLLKELVPDVGDEEHDSVMGARQSGSCGSPTGAEPLATRVPGRGCHPAMLTRLIRVACNLCLFLWCLALLFYVIGSC